MKVTIIWCVFLICFINFGLKKEIFFNALFSDVPANQDANPLDVERSRE